MGRCDTKLAQDIMFDCDDISQKGVESEGVIVNYADINKAGCTRTGNILSAFPLVNGAKGYKIVVPEGSPFNGTMIEAVVGTYKTKWDKTVAFVVLNSGPDVSHDVIDKLANGKFVVILRNKFGGSQGKNTYEVYGFEQGLKLSAGARDLNSDDTDGGWSVTLQEKQAPSSGLFLYDTDLATTKTLVDTLTTAQGNN